MHQALIALGANIGNKEANVLRAVDMLDQLPKLQVEKVSKIHVTAPIGGPENQDMFANAAILVNSELKAPEVVEKLLEIEVEFGRHRDIRWQARELDLDLLLYGDEVLTETDYIIPHPRMSFRRFVLEPAAEVAPEMRHPIANLTISDLLNRINQPLNLIGICSQNPDSDRELARIIEKKTSNRSIPFDQLDQFYDNIQGAEVDSGEKSQVTVCWNYQKTDSFLPKLLVGMVECGEQSPDQLQEFAKKNLFPDFNGPYLILNVNDLNSGCTELVAAIQAMI